MDYELGIDFLEPLSKAILSGDEDYLPGQLGYHIVANEGHLPDVELADLVLIGVQEYRGAGGIKQKSNAADAIRKQLYRLHYWHSSVKIADVGNIRNGATVEDTNAAIKAIVASLIQAGKTAIIIGGSHDCTLGLYGAYKEMNTSIEATCIDAKIDLGIDSAVRSENFLMEMLTGEPNYIKHYNHLAFQSYFVHPQMLQTLDKLHFDFFRVGVVSSDLAEMEPVLRNTNMLSVDVNAIKYSDAPANKNSPNGLTGMEACALAKYAGMSPVLSSIGFFGYDPEDDVAELTAAQISQMIWYFIDGKYKIRDEADTTDLSGFNEYHTVFSEVEALFIQSRHTQRWWMQMPDKNFVPCSKKDYLLASTNEMPERWLRIQERSA